MFLFQVIQLEEVLAPPAPPPVRVNYTDLDLSGVASSLNASPITARPSAPVSQEPSTDYAVIDFEATSAAAQAGRDHVRLRQTIEQRRDQPLTAVGSSLSRTPSTVATCLLYTSDAADE